MTLVKEAKKQQQPEPEDDNLPKLWILTPTLSDRLLESMGAKLELDRWGEGVYVLSSGLETGIVVIHQLPQTPKTLWFRLLGGEARMLLRLLNRRFEAIPNRFADRVRELNVFQLEELGEALLDFTSLADLEAWLSRD